MVGNFAFEEDDNYRDVLLQGDIDAGVRNLAAQAGWERELDAQLVKLQEQGMSPTEVDRALGDFSPAAARATMRCVQSDPRLTAEAVKRFKRRVEKRETDIVNAYRCVPIWLSSVVYFGGLD